MSMIELSNIASKAKDRNTELEEQNQLNYNAFPLSFSFKNAVKDYQLELYF